MLTLQQTAWMSFFLHILAGGALIMTSKEWSHPHQPISMQEKSRPVMVNFVRLGPRSAAPVLGASSARKEAASKVRKPESKTQAQLTAAHQERPKASSSRSVSTVQTPPKSQRNSAVQSSQSVKPEKKPAAKPQNKSTSKKTVVSSSPSVNKKETSSTRAKVDLTQRPIARSMDELVKKVPTAKTSVGGGHGPDAAFAETYGEELTGTDIDLLNRHMKAFWNMPSGHEKAYNTVVEIELFIRRDGTIEKATLVELDRYRRDPEYRIAAESALRAVLDPDCSPLPLNPAKYEQWKHMIFVFDPREMCR